MRRSLALTLVAAAGATAAAQDDGAEKLFRGTQDKVRTAKTLRVRYDITITDALGKMGALKGVLVLGEGQKYRSEGEGMLFGEPVKFAEVSDGTRTSYRDATDPKRDTTEKAVPNAGTYFRAALPRDGFGLSSLNLKQRSEWPAEACKLSDFRLAGKEWVGNREAQVVEYRVTVKGATSPAPAKVWLDTKTGLPIKMVLSGGQSDIKDITETYDEFAVDVAVDAKAFDPPK